MDELRGPNIQIVLHVKEGLGFGFLKSPFVVSGSLNGYMLETDPVVPVHAPIFDAELVWEADKRRFRSLRVQNVPVKIEVYTTGTQGRKDKVGYLLLSLLGAQPCPANRIVDVKHSWHKLLGVKSEGKCCHPQLLMSLSIEDRVSTPTPRNELRMFHSNEVAYPSQSNRNPSTNRPLLMTMDDYIAESKKTVLTPELQPKLMCDEGLIQIGTGNQIFLLELVIGSVENLDLLIPPSMTQSEAVDCYVTYSVFTHTIMTDRVALTSTAHGLCAQFNQRTTLRLRTDLPALARYVEQCPHLVAMVCLGGRELGVCGLDLRKLVPTTDAREFVAHFCNRARSRAVHERCYLQRCDEAAPRAPARRPYVDVEMGLQCAAAPPAPQPQAGRLTARSASQLGRDRGAERVDAGALECRGGSCTHVDSDAAAVAYTSAAPANTARYKTASGDSVLQTNEIAELIRKMCDSFASTQERLAMARPSTSDAQVQCQSDEGGSQEETTAVQPPTLEAPSPRTAREGFGRAPVRLETSKSDTCVNTNVKAAPPTIDPVRSAVYSADRTAAMQKVVEELEDWKERQQELFRCQLKRKEEYHLELLAREWAKKRAELESRLARGVEQCRSLAADLSRATDDFRLRGYRNTERERKLLEAKKALESHYTAKYQELREASQKMQDDMNHQLKLKDMRIEELEAKGEQMEKQLEVLKNNLRNCEKDAESRYSGLTKDQTASLIQELRCLEQKLEGALQSKAFFKEQWGRAVRELHVAKLAARRQLLLQLRRRRRQLADCRLDTIDDHEENSVKEDGGAGGLDHLKDDFYVDLLANTPAVESHHSLISTSVPDGMELFDELNASKVQTADKLNELIAQRDALVQQDSPDEGELRQLNQDIRAMLLNCGT